MSDFKATYDRVLQAQADRDVIMNQIDTELAKGTPEGDQAALDLRPALDGAQTKAMSLETLYANMQLAATSKNITAQFVPVSTTLLEAVAIQGETQPNVLNMAEYNQLAPKERLAFAKRGGKLEDKE